VPIWSIDLGTLGPTVRIVLPKSNELWTVVGVLQDELDQKAVVGYQARALVGDRLVSTVVKTDAQGRFTLKIPNDAANAINLDQVRVELTPSDPTAVEPHIEANVTATKLNLGILRLPPRPKAQSLDIPVHVLGKPDKKLPGVTLRFSAEIPNAVGGRAWLVREAQTDKDGVAHVALLPGNAGTTREYAVTVVPPANSEFAARCLPSYSVATTAAGRTGASIELGNKPDISGLVTDAGLAPQAGVIITATPLAVSGTQECGSSSALLPPPTTVTTGAGGGYRLSLDPGRYRIEYEPPMGSPSPLFIENDVLVDMPQERRRLALPSGVVATGLVRDDSGVGVPGGELRVFGPPKAGRPPELRARTRTGADGRFMIVLPQNP
jgi:hypothetical protein